MIDERLSDLKACTGCHACSSICPTACIGMPDDAEGFWYPAVDPERCIRCGRCVAVCPLLSGPLLSRPLIDDPLPSGPTAGDPPAAPAERNDPAAYACRHRDEAVRLSSSSGGVFSQVAENILASGGVVVGAAFNEDFSGVSHQAVDRYSRIGRLRGSKYLQSRINDGFIQVREFLQSGRNVLFSGTPCQIAGLLAFLGGPDPNLVTMDFICHGVPSPAVWRAYVAFREKAAGSTVRQVSFRQKDAGWKRYAVFFSFANGREWRRSHQADAYMRAFLKDICLRPSCHRCAFKSLERLSDLTLADFWGIENVLPAQDDDKGTSLIIVNSEKGRQVFDGICEGLFYEQADLAEAIRYNPAAIRSAKRHPNRDDFFAGLGGKPFDRLVHQYCKDDMPVRIRRLMGPFLRFASRCRRRFTG